MHTLCSYLFYKNIVKDYEYNNIHIYKYIFMTVTSNFAIEIIANLSWPEMYKKSRSHIQWIKKHKWGNDYLKL